MTGKVDWMKKKVENNATFQCSDGTNTKKSDRNSSKIVKCQIQGRIVGYSLLY